MNKLALCAPALALALILGACGGGTSTSRSSGPPPTQASPAFVYVSNRTTNGLTGLDVAGGKPANLPSALPSSGGTAPIGMVATGKLLYIANSGSDTVNGFSFDANTGALQPLPGSPYFAAVGVSQLALCPGNGGATAPKFIYAVAPSGVFGYSIAGTGQLTAVPGSPFPAGTQAAAVVADAACNFLFVASKGSNDISAFSVNPSTGQLTPVAGSPFAAGTAPVALASGDGFLFVANSGSNDVSAFVINTATGTGAFLRPVTGSPFAAGSSPSALVYFSPTLYVANAASSNVSAFTVTATVGNFTPVTGSPFSVGTQPKAMITVSPPAGNTAQQTFLYVANSGSGDLSAFSIGAGGALTVVQGFPFPAGQDPEGLAFACAFCGYP